MRMEDVIKNVLKDERPIYIWGTRAWGATLGVWFEEKDLVFEGYVDNDKKKQGEIIWGTHKCITPQELPTDSFVIITAADADRCQEIKNQVELINAINEKKIECITNCIEDIAQMAEFLDDEKTIKAIYQAHMRCKADLDNPKNFNEKLNWLKLHDRKLLYTQMVDKVEAKKMVSQKMGKRFVIPTLGVWNSFDEIDFDSLPQQFVLKCTHDSGTIVVVNDKSKMDIAAVRKKIESKLRLNFFYQAREWPYKDVKPRIIAEKYIDTLGKRDSIEYKITCFNGKVDFITICVGVAHDAYDKRTNNHFDRNFNEMPWYAFYKHSNQKFTKPKQWQEMIEFAETFAKDIPYLRVDCYIIEDQLVFGEFTFFTWAGLIEFVPEEWNRIFGDRIKLI